MTVNLGAGTASGLSSIASILNVTGTAQADILIAGAGNNTLNGGLGADIYTVNDAGGVTG